MPIVDLPFKVEEPQEVHGGDPFSCSLYKMLPEPMQESTRDTLNKSVDYGGIVP